MMEIEQSLGHIMNYHTLTLFRKRKFYFLQKIMKRPTICQLQAYNSEIVKINF
jgi:hypothetical protein